MLGCSNSTPAALETCLQQANVTEVAMRQYDVFTSSELLGIPFLPVVDGDFLPSDVDVCLLKCVLVFVLLKYNYAPTKTKTYIFGLLLFVFCLQTLLTSNTLLKTDVLLGLNHDEGTYFLMYGVPGFGIKDESLISRAQFLDIVDVVVPRQDNVTREAIIFEYSDWANVSSPIKNRNCVGKMVTDSVFICSVQDFGSRY